MNLIILADYQQCGIVVLISCVGNAVCVRACVCSMVGCLGSVCLRPYSEACVFQRLACVSQAISRRGEIYEDPLRDKHSQQERATRHFSFLTQNTHTHTNILYSQKKSIAKQKHFVLLVCPCRVAIFAVSRSLTQGLVQFCADII